MKRKPPSAGKGRPKGATNKITRAFKTAVLALFNRMGEDRGLSGEDAFLEWARKNPTDFYKIAARLIPHEVVGSGDNGEHIIKAVVDVYER